MNWFRRKSKDKQVVFYLHRYGYLPQSVTVHYSNSINDFPFNRVFLHLSIPKCKVWFMDKNGVSLDFEEEEEFEGARVFWVTVKL